MASCFLKKLFTKPNTKHSVNASLAQSECLHVRPDRVVTSLSTAPAIKANTVELLGVHIVFRPCIIIGLRFARTLLVYVKLLLTRKGRYLQHATTDGTRRHCLSTQSWA